MADERLRALQAAASASGTAEDEAAWLRERVRVGELSAQRLRLAAYLRHRAARLALGEEVPALPPIAGPDDPQLEELERVLFELGGWEAKVRAGVAMFRLSLPDSVPPVLNPDRFARPEAPRADSVPQEERSADARDLLERFERCLRGLFEARAKEEGLFDSVLDVEDELDTLCEEDEGLGSAVEAWRDWLKERVEDDRDDQAPDLRGRGSLPPAVGAALERFERLLRDRRAALEAVGERERLAGALRERAATLGDATLGARLDAIEGRLEAEGEEPERAQADDASGGPSRLVDLGCDMSRYAPWISKLDAWTRDPGPGRAVAADLESIPRVHVGMKFELFLSSLCAWTHERDAEDRCSLAEGVRLFMLGPDPIGAIQSELTSWALSRKGLRGPG